MAEEKAVKEVLYAIIYDLPSEHEVTFKDKGSPTEKEREALKRERTKTYLRQAVFNRVMSIGTYINRSVYLLPKEHLDKAKNLVSEFLRRYRQELNIEPELYILQFAGASSEILKEKALKSLSKRLDKLLDSLDTLDEKLAKKKQDITQGEKNRIIKNVEVINELANKFKIKKDLANLLKIVDEKIKAI